MNDVSSGEIKRCRPRMVRCVNTEDLIKPKTRCAQPPKPCGCKHDRNWEKPNQLVLKKFGVCLHVGKRNHEVTRKRTIHEITLNFTEQLVLPVCWGDRSMPRAAKKMPIQ